MTEPVAKRFADVNDQDVENVLSSRVPRATRETTRQWLTVFDSYLKANKIVGNLDTATKEEISEILCKCYVGLRTQKGEYYQRASYAGFRVALNRHLLKRNINIISDPSFRRANEVFDSVLKQLQREGNLKPTDHKDEISKQDMDKIDSLFTRTKDTTTLTRHVWFIITYHLGLRG